MIEGFNKFIAWIARNIKKIIGMVIIIAIMAVVFTTAFKKGYEFMRADSYVEKDNNGKMVTLNVPENTTVDEIAEMLVDMGVLDSTFEFKIKAKLAGASDFKFGVYYIQENESVDDIISILKAGDQSKVVRVAVNPGMTIDELADQLETLNVCYATYFRKNCNSTSYDMSVLREIDTQGRRYALEGYLLPGTYQIIQESDSTSVIAVFLDEFDHAYTSALAAKVEESGFTLDQVLTMASVVQAECALESDYATFASMLLNRINNWRSALHYWSMPSTVLYAQQRYDDALTSVNELDQEYDSPYNTYLYEGFPPGPICNPSIEAITAVLYPAETDYLYYEIDLTNRNGARHFSCTEDEHEAYLASQR